LHFESRTPGEKYDCSVKDLWKRKMEVNDDSEGVMDGESDESIELPVI